MDITFVLGMPTTQTGNRVVAVHEVTSGTLLGIVEAVDVVERMARDFCSEGLQGDYGLPQDVLRAVGLALAG